MNLQLLKTVKTVKNCENCPFNRTFGFNTDTKVIPVTVNSYFVVVVEIYGGFISNRQLGSFSFITAGIRGDGHKHLV